MVREASEAGADAVWPGETRRGEQADHPEGLASPESSRRIDLNERKADEACAHDLISHGAVWRTGGAMDKKVKKKVLQQIPYGAYIVGDRKSTRLNSSHANISYAVFCLKKKK